LTERKLRCAAALWKQLSSLPLQWFISNRFPGVCMAYEWQKYPMECLRSQGMSVLVHKDLNSLMVVLGWILVPKIFLVMFFVWLSRVPLVLQC
jgi:hypothetical protein